MSAIHRPDWVYKSHVFDRWLPKQKLSSWSFAYGANCVCPLTFAHTHALCVAHTPKFRVSFECETSHFGIFHHHPRSSQPFFVLFHCRYWCCCCGCRLPLHTWSARSNASRLFNLFGWKAINKEACKWIGSDGFVSNTHYTHTTHPEHKRIKHIQHQVTEIHMLKSASIVWLSVSTFKYEQVERDSGRERA